MVTREDGACFQAVSHISTAADGVPALHKFGGSFLFMGMPFCRRTTKFDVIKHVVERRVSWGQSRLPSPVFMPA